MKKCGNDFQSQPCKLPKSSENDNYAEVNVTENKHHPKPRPPADTTVFYSDHIMKGQPAPPPYDPVELKQATVLQASATVIPAGVKVDDTGNSNPPMDYDSCHHLPVEKNYPPPHLQMRMKANYFLFLIVVILIQLEMLNTYQKWVPLMGGCI